MTLWQSLNPCFSGTYSRSVIIHVLAINMGVLILVLVEHTLGAHQKRGDEYIQGLNPCFSGTYSRSPHITSTSPYVTSS